MSALAAKLVCEARELSRQGAVVEARQLVRRALGTLPDGERLPEAEELLEQLEPKPADSPLAADFRAFLAGADEFSTAGAAATVEARVDDTAERPALGRPPQTPSVDAPFVDEAEQRRRQSSRRARIVGCVVGVVICIYPITEVIRVWSPHAADGPAKVSSSRSAGPRVAMPELDFGAGRKPHRYADAEVRRLFVSNSRGMAARPAGGIDRRHRAATSERAGGQGNVDEPATGASNGVLDTPGGRERQQERQHREDAASVASQTPYPSHAAGAAADGVRTSAPSDAVASRGEGGASVRGQEQSDDPILTGQATSRAGAMGGRARDRRTAARPSSLPPSTSARKARARGGRYFAPGRTLTVSNVASRPRAKPIKLPVRTRIQAQLDLGITSRRHGTVHAVVQETVGSGADTIPRGATLVGHSEDDGERIYVTITEVLINGEPRGLKAVATENGYPGLEPQRHESSLEQRQGVRVAQGAIDVAGDIARRAAGVAAPIVDGVVDEAASEHTVDRSVILAVPSGHPFVARVLH